jgi:hypothetical protein
MSMGGRSETSGGSHRSLRESAELGHVRRGRREQLPQSRGLQYCSDPLLPKPDRALLSPATMGNGAGRSHSGTVRGCPVGTAEDRCEWHASGMAGENDDRPHLAGTAPSWSGG